MKTLGPQKGENPKHCHAELVSASHLIVQLSEIPDRVRDDSLFSSDDILFQLPLNFGSVISRIPSPSMLKERIVMRMLSPE